MSMKQLIAALRSGRQADVDGTTVIVSRQACEEAADALEAKLDKDPDDRRDNMPIEIKAWHSTPTLDHIGSWATTRYPEFTVAYVRKDSIAALEQAVDVKGLPWDGSPPETYQFAEPALGLSYDVSTAGGVFVVTRTTIFGNLQLARLGSMDAAKAAAQADFEKLILSNIDARSVVQVQAEALSDAAKGSEQGPAVEVKPLSWGKAEEDGMNLQADCPFGRYYLALRGEYGWTWWRPSSGPAHMGIEPTEEAAEAAAQADYERRILSAITARKRGDA